MKIKSKSYKTYFSPSKYANLPPKMWVVSRGQIYKYDAWFGRMYNKLTRWRPGGLATAFYLAAVRLSIIAPVRKSVNHSRTIVSMRETGWEQQQGVRLLSDSTVWNEFAFGPVGHCFLCCNQFLSAVMWSLRFPLLVLRLWCGLLSKEPDQWTLIVNRHCSSMPDLLTHFISLNAASQAVFLFRRPARLKKGPTQLQCVCRRVYFFKWKAQN